MIIGKALKMALVKAGKKQLELADEIGVHHQLVSRWANNKHISPSKLDDVCKSLGYTVSEFIALGEK